MSTSTYNMSPLVAAIHVSDIQVMKKILRIELEEQDEKIGQTKEEFNKNMTRAFLMACKTNKTEFALELLPHVFDVNVQSEEMGEKTAAIFACINKNEKLLKALIETKKVKWNFKDGSLNTALTYAILNNFEFGVQMIMYERASQLNMECVMNNIEKSFSKV